jgi:hypothetical protein
MAAPSNPILITPNDQTLLIGSALVFVFTVPFDDDNNLLVFKLELDTNNSISSSSLNYKMHESRLAVDKKINGRWEVQDGAGVYISMMSGGVGSSYYGRNAKVIIRKQDTAKFPNIETTWYWKISASDLLNVTPVFNRVVFGQGVFSS